MLPVLLPLAAFLLAGIEGVDFGRHWDEQEHLENVRHSLQTQTLLPDGGYTLDNDPRLAVGYYAYPSVLYWIALASAGPEVLHNLDDVTRPELADFVLSEAFRLRVRTVCIVISSLAIVWVYLIVLRLGGSWPQALLAGMLLAGSWEISYHSRWIATDTIVMQFAALCLLLCVGAMDSAAAKKWTQGAAIAAGLAAGTKYPGALLLVPVLLAAWMRGKRWSSLAQLCLIAGATFIVTTPGALLQPWAFVHWLAHQHRHYGQETHWGYTVAGSADHLLKILTYETLVLFSPWPLSAAALFAMTVIGAALLWNNSRQMAVLICSFPILYVAYFSTQRVMIARNLIVLCPFVALLSARGVSELLARLRQLPRLAGAAAVAVIVLLNVAFTIHAAWTIRQAGRSMTYDLVELRDYMNDHPRTRFDLSAQTRDLLAQLDSVAAARQPPANPDREEIVVCSHEDGGVLQWPANQWNMTRAAFGPLDVNFNYYPTWPRDRIVMLDLDRAHSLAVDSVQRVVHER